MARYEVATLWPDGSIADLTGHYRTKGEAQAVAARRTLAQARDRVRIMEEYDNRIMAAISDESTEDPIVLEDVRAAVLGTLTYRYAPQRCTNGRLCNADL